MSPKPFVLLAGAIVAAVLRGPAAASDGGAEQSRLEIGVRHVLASTALGERRTVNVVLPASYRSHPDRRYPVVYVIDGGVEQDLLPIAGAARAGALWGRSGEAIVVGVETRDRRRELTGPTADPALRTRYPTAGASARFRAFLGQEVKPLVERLYRTGGRDVVIGESLAGLFIVETYLTEPGLFGAYGAVDPSLWWDGEALSKAAAARLGAGQAGRPLLIATAKEQLDTPAAYRRLVAALHGARLSPCLVPRPDQTHATVYQQVVPMVLQYLVPSAQAAPAAYGFALTCSDAP